MDYVKRRRSTVGGALEKFSLPLPLPLPLQICKDKCVYGWNRKCVMCTSSLPLTTGDICIMPNWCTRASSRPKAGDPNGRRFFWKLELTRTPDPIRLRQIPGVWDIFRGSSQRNRWMSIKINDKLCQGKRPMLRSDRVEVTVHFYLASAHWRAILI